MYKVFVNDRAMILTNVKENSEEVKQYKLKKCDIAEVIKEASDLNGPPISLYHKNEEKLISKLKKKITPVYAGGGLVKNAKGEILFIFRNQKWDLPKGKTEKGEDIETTAIREVEEETGVLGLEITNTLPITYHVFRRNGAFKLKITHWFEMKTSHDAELIPQLEEDITKVEWKTLGDAKEALKNSYANIRLLFSEEFF
ncbi:NUDIX hydrolase [Spongiivirga citrea]|uniref:NUDIX domain-containing protein n=1 Tax=Spongiivirga citrea TaxID=1481457 RepID=A0A6M0CKD1_9FLAO|nr:NUDIX domain-containing protein [Spongiivirga citrea]NER18405.1 NUDIX domain-containing protein [Spongiivirga citrea]